MRQLPTIAAATLTAAAVFACGHTAATPTNRPQPAADERHFGAIRQLTFGGENAEAYFSRDGRRLIFQSTRDGRPCDQQYVMNVDGSDVRRVSTGTGKTTCGFFYAGDERILFGSSHALQQDCPPKPDPSKGYAWRLDPFDLYTARTDGSNLRRLTHFG